MPANGRRDLIRRLKVNLLPNLKVCGTIELYLLSFCPFQWQHNDMTLEHTAENGICVNYEGVLISD